METKSKVMAVAGALGVAGALLVGVGVFVGKYHENAALVVAEGGVLAAFLAGVVAAVSGAAARGLDAREEALHESAILSLREG